MRIRRPSHRNSHTFLVHVFGRGLDGDRYVVERFRSQPDGQIHPVQAEQPRAGSRSRPHRTIVSAGEVKKMLPERDEIIIFTALNLKASGVQLWSSPDSALRMPRSKLMSGSISIEGEGAKGARVHRLILLLQAYGQHRQRVSEVRAKILVEEGDHATLRIVACPNVPLHRVHFSAVALHKIRPLHRQVEGMVRARIHLQPDDGFVAGAFGDLVEILASVRRRPLILAADQNQDGAYQGMGPAGLAPGIVGDKRGKRAPALTCAGIDVTSLCESQGGSAAERLADVTDAVLIHERHRCQTVECGVRVSDLHGIVGQRMLTSIGDAAPVEAVDDQRDVTVPVQQLGVLNQSAPHRLMLRVPLGPATAVRQYDSREGTAAVRFREQELRSRARLCGGGRDCRSLRQIRRHGKRDSRDQGAHGAIPSGNPHPCCPYLPGANDSGGVGERTSPRRAEMDVEKAIIRRCESLPRPSVLLLLLRMEHAGATLSMVRPLHWFIKGLVGTQIHLQLDDGLLLARLATSLGFLHRCAGALVSNHPHHRSESGLGVPSLTCSGAMIASLQMAIVRALCRNGYRCRQAE